MPKNKKPSFKHYISTRSSTVLNEEVGHDHDDHDDDIPGPSVRERLNRSRAEAGPARARGGGEWTVATSCMPLRAAWPDLENETTTPIPTRRGAGPAPPPSWRQVPKSNVSKSEPVPDLAISPEDLVDASALLGEGRIRASPVKGVSPLSHYIYRAVIGYLDCSDIYWTDDDGISTTYGQYLRDQARDYWEESKVGLLASHSSHPAPRLLDKTIQTILCPPLDTDSEMSTHDDWLNSLLDIKSQDDSWDEGPLTPMIHHLGITCHPDPYRLLRSINALPTIALTSLNLAYSAIPQVEKLVLALPIGMKELGLVGVRCTSEEDFLKMVGLLGKRLKLLHTLDLSHCKHMALQALIPLLYPPERQLPSLRRLGLRGSHQNSTSSEFDAFHRALVFDPAAEVKRRRMWMDRTMTGRRRHVEVIWE